LHGEKKSKINIFSENPALRKTLPDRNYHTAVFTGPLKNGAIADLLQMAPFPTTTRHGTTRPIVEQMDHVSAK